ncbi:MAG TPA: family 10 glycosylhydrolase [Longimicrobiales bacterium]|nr:family 10 glycosylhydrolase [Longimicrobiales bacterium]
MIGHIRCKTSGYSRYGAAIAAALLITACASVARAPVPSGDVPPAIEREFRGVWIAAVSNLDWPSRPGLPTDSQKAELIRMLDRARELRLNAVIFHIRPAGDALYASDLEPWSEYLTGQQGRAPDPYYDPLEFAVAEAHARGLELHAWFNPYRARHPSARGELAATHIANTSPDLVKNYGSYLWMDPGEPAVRQRSVDVVVDVVRRYDIDGVHIDDYFYPYREVGPDGREIDFPDSASYARYRAGGGSLGRSDWRRANVDLYVAELYAAVKRVKPLVKVGISPIGTWRPNVRPQLGGFDAYESIFADARKWVMDGDLDYLVPQLYWPIARTDVSFPVLLDWWVQQNPRGRGMYAGLIPGNVNLDTGGRAGWAPDEIIGQIYITRGRPGAEGHVHFRMGSLMPDGAFGPIAGADTLPPARLDSIRAMQARAQARRDTMTAKMMRETYARPALTPAMTWLDDDAPPTPRSALRASGDSTVVMIEPGRGETAFLWVVQSRWPDGWRTEVIPASTRLWTAGRSSGGSGRPVAVWVSAVDRSGNQSPPSQSLAMTSGNTEAAAAPERPAVTPERAAVAPERTAVAPSRPQAAAAAQRPELPPGVIPHSQWEASPPLGHAADATRRNLRPGDRLAFRDMSVTVLGTDSDTTTDRSTADIARLRLARGEVQEEREVTEGQAFNWQGYHIAIVAVYGPGELGAGLTAVEVATAESLPREVATATTAGGADLRLRIPHEITHVTLHHTGSVQPLRPEDDPVQKLRGLQSWGASDRNWWDVPYHFLIDLDGRVYEGRDWRYMGETNTTYDPRGHFLISVIGNYGLQEETPAQVEAIADLMAWAIARFDLPLDRIGGHYDYADTTCPGEHLKQYLEDGTLRRMVERRLAERGMQ